jgi:transcriptional regulator with XRE-family HTH domain
MQVSSPPTTRDLLARLKSLKNLETDYQVAKYLGVAHQTVRNWQKGASTLDTKAAQLMADALGEDAGFIALCVAVEREKNPEVRQDMSRVLLRAIAA